MSSEDVLSIQQASTWAASYTKKDVTPSNIAYLVQYGLIRKIGENTGMQIINQFRRPVLNRTEKDKGAYSEGIFHLKSNDNKVIDDIIVHNDLK